MWVTCASSVISVILMPLGFIDDLLFRSPSSAHGFGLGHGLLVKRVIVVSTSDSGTFLGLGTVTGSVAIYITFSLQVRRVQVCGAAGPVCDSKPVCLCRGCTT